MAFQLDEDDILLQASGQGSCLDDATPIPELKARLSLTAVQCRAVCMGTGILSSSSQ